MHALHDPSGTDSTSPFGKLLVLQQTHMGFAKKTALHRSVSLPSDNRRSIVESEVRNMSSSLHDANLRGLTQ